MSVRVTMPAMVQSSVHQPRGPQGFQDELLAAISPLRQGLGHLLGEIGGPRTATALEKMLGVGHTICWQVFRIVHAEDIVAEVRLAPSPAGLKRLLAAAHRQGATKETVAEVHFAANEFRLFMKRHADDRAAFDTMVAGVAGVAEDQSVERIQLTHRRGAYRNEGHIWGCQVDVTSMTALVRRSASGEGVDACYIGRTLGIRRLRPDTLISMYGENVQAHGTQTSSSRRPLDAGAAGIYEVPILPQFSTSPVPPMVRIDLPIGWTIYNLAGNNIGLRSSISATFATVGENNPLMKDVDGRSLYHVTMDVGRPAALLVMDVLVHRLTLGATVPQLMVYRRRESDWTQEGARLSHKLPVEERVNSLGRADQFVPTADLPAHKEALEFATSKLGWDLGEFDLHRVRMVYPVYSSSVRMWFHVDVG